MVLRSKSKFPYCVWLSSTGPHRSPFGYLFRLDVVVLLGNDSHPKMCPSTSFSIPLNTSAEKWRWQHRPTHPSHRHLRCENMIKQTSNYGKIKKKHTGTVRVGFDSNAQLWSVVSAKMQITALKVSSSGKSSWSLSITSSKHRHSRHWLHFSHEARNCIVACSVELKLLYYEMTARTSRQSAM